MQRTRNDKFIDILLTLYTIQIAAVQTRVVSILMIQKILFLTSIQYRENLLRVLSQSFYRWHKGPMSDEVYSDFNDMSNYGFITGDITKDVHITEHGQRVLDSTFQLIQKEKQLVEPLRRIASDVKRLDELMEKVYSKEVYVEEMDKILPIIQVPEGMHILTPIWRDEAKETMTLDNAWIETLELMLVPEVDAAIRKSIEDAKKGRIHPLELD